MLAGTARARVRATRRRHQQHRPPVGQRGAARERVARGRGGRARERGRARGQIPLRGAQRGALLLHKKPLPGRPTHVRLPLLHRGLRRHI